MVRKFERKTQCGPDKDCLIAAVNNVIERNSTILLVFDSRSKFFERFHMLSCS